MIRGTLFLILALVVLTLGQGTGNTCTCQDNSGSVKNSASARFSLDITRVDYIKPDTATTTSWTADLSNFDSITAIQSTLASATATADVTQKITDLTAFLENVNARVEFLQGLNDTVVDQTQHLGVILGEFYDQFDTVKETYDAQLAAKFSQTLLEISSQVRASAAAVHRLGVQLNQAVALQTLCNDKLDWLNDFKTFSEAVDAKVTACGSGLTCTRAIAIPQVFASPPIVPGDFIAKITTFATSIQDYTTSTTSETTQYAADFQSRTTEDDTDDEDRITVWNNWGQNQQNGGCPYETYRQAILALDASADKNLAFVKRILQYLPADKYQVTGQTLTCTGQDDQSGVINCTFAGTIAATGNDGDVGVEKLLASARQCAMAYLGCLYVDAVSEFDQGTGEFKITWSCSKNKVNIFIQSVKDAVVRAINNIDVFVAAALKEANAHWQEASDDAVAVDNALNSYLSNATGFAFTAADQAASVKNSLDLADDAKNTYITLQEARETQLQTTADIYACAKDAWINFFAEWKGDREACIAAYARNLDQAKCNVASAVANLLQAKSNYLHDQTNEAVETYWTNSSESIKSDIQTYSTIKTQIETIHDALKKDHDKAVAGYDAAATDLGKKYDNLKAGVELNLEDIQADWNTDVSAAEDKAKKALCGLRRIIDSASVTIKIDNADGSNGKYVKLHASWTETGATGTADEIEKQHILCIQAVVGLIGCNKGFVVTKVTSTKRQAGSNEYAATLGDAPPDTTPSGSPSGSPVGGSSGNTLVFSLVWAVVASFVLVWF